MKNFEREKFLALKENHDNYEALMFCDLTSLKDDLKWWKDNIKLANNQIKNPNSRKEIFADASRSGWGAYCHGEKANGHWNDKGKSSHINYLELSAVFFALKCFAHELTNCDILLRIDNTTGLAYVNKMGGIKYLLLNSLAKEIWMWCENRDI